MRTRLGLSCESKESFPLDAVRRSFGLFLQSNRILCKALFECASLDEAAALSHALLLLEEGGSATSAFITDLSHGPLGDGFQCQIPYRETPARYFRNIGLV